MRVAWLVLALAGCNQVLGIGDTRAYPTEDFDFDHDGIENHGDNCPTVANTNQRDADGDGFGDVCDPCPDGPESGDDRDQDGTDDACDPCLLGPQHDEDGDGIYDDCDNCPAIANPAQADDGDGDDLGAACDDAVGTVQARRTFDGFGQMLPTWVRWQLWASVGDAAVPNTALGLVNYTLADPTIGVTAGSDWTIDAGVVPPRSGYGTIGIQFEGPGSLYTVGCELWKKAPNLFSVTAAGLQSSEFPDPGTYVVLRLTRRGDVYHCGMVGTTNELDVPATVTYPLTAGLHSQTDGGIGYLEVVQ